MTVPALLAAGASKYAWLNPGETPGGVPAALAAQWEHGAFLYAPADGADAVFFRVVAAPPTPPPTPLLPTKTVSEAIADAVGIPLAEVREARAAEAALYGGGS